MYANLEPLPSRIIPLAPPIPNDIEKPLCKICNKSVNCLQRHLNTVHSLKEVQLFYRENADLFDARLDLLRTTKQISAVLQEQSLSRQSPLILPNSDKPSSAFFKYEAKSVNEVAAALHTALLDSPEFLHNKSLLEDFHNSKADNILCVQTRQLLDDSTLTVTKLIHRLLFSCPGVTLLKDGEEMVNDVFEDDASSSYFRSVPLVPPTSANMPTSTRIPKTFASLLRNDIRIILRLQHSLARYFRFKPRGENNEVESDGKKFDVLKALVIGHTL